MQYPIQNLVESHTHKSRQYFLRDILISNKKLQQIYISKNFNLYLSYFFIADYYNN
jgi:hypothetical protein